MHRTKGQKKKMCHIIGILWTRIFGFTEVIIKYNMANIISKFFVTYRNKGVKTVEEELLLALKSKNLITDEGFEQIQTMHFQRAARTDKGVSALRQIISLLLRKYF